MTKTRHLPLTGDLSVSELRESGDRALEWIA
jgi:hypothetical protein